MTRLGGFALFMVFGFAVVIGAMALSVYCLTLSV